MVCKPVLNITKERYDAVLFDLDIPTGEKMIFEQQSERLRKNET